MGKHSKPTLTMRIGTTGRRMVPALGVGTVVAAGVVTPAFLGSGLAHASGTLDEIAQCESGGDPTAQNASSTASGLYQFLDSTWNDYGGYARAMDAPASVQREKAEQMPLSAWAASKSCWGGATSAATDETGSAGSDSTEANVPAATRDSAPEPEPAVDEHRNSDGTGHYRCDTGHLYLNDCDADTLGTVQNYPPYDEPPVVPPSPTVHLADLSTPPAHRSADAGSGSYRVVSGDNLYDIAQEHGGSSWQRLYEKNKEIIGADADHILPGQQLAL